MFIKQTYTNEHMFATIGTFQVHINFLTSRRKNRLRNYNKFVDMVIRLFRINPACIIVYHCLTIQYFIIWKI